ncbi:hypothetical protein EFM62_03250 [Enterococcus faecium]|uniref:Uncharacterized protein n=2 Tax=Enterococcus faecium TaxID=1352 RepID=A0A7V7KSM2_ENTFC|nr:hypothetical protein DTX73_09685 [Enterococcus faecium]MCS8591956.1 hypothetical protein [Enterococcus faecium]
MSLNPSEKSTDGFNVLHESLADLSSPKVHSLQFISELDRLIQKINLEIGLNGMGSWAKATAIARKFGSRN